MQLLEQRLEAMEERTRASETLAEVSGGRTRTLEDQIRVLQDQVDDLENKSRTKKLLDREEGGDLTGFLQEWFLRFLQLELESGLLSVGRAW
ncbi:hypothetical protein chiPu_0018647 [Chiloscyllium punctatum]|uniref:Uncharacterized protein n=1 Tax=Chiloscyllium punctatum TaxID=137246 RepID=A0A401RP74_CHIPU|nr:hypothetical protein [Chiloscyllium punctatum]